MRPRYNPFSNSSALVDSPISRCGSTLLLLLEPKELPVLEHSPSGYPSPNSTHYTPTAASSSATYRPEELTGATR